MQRPTELGWLPLALCIPAVLAAQGRDWEFHRGRWYNGNRSDSYEFRTSARWGGPFTHGFGAQVFLHDSLGRRRAFYGLGYELQAFRGRRALEPYALAGVALGLSTDTTTQELAAQWSVGGGIEWRPLSRFALGAEARYRVEDRGPRGFWRTSDARTGLSGAVGITLRLGRGEGGRGSGGYGSPPRPPPEPPATITGSAADIVRTALDALGTPYLWGGTAGNGFDCSGLIQYAYGQHGIRLPRMGRAQASAGADVAPSSRRCGPATSCSSRRRRDPA